ncbi:peptidyl-prolyl cis-trans isomerase [Paludibacterium denitrificans]|uniref:peptidyl-prolyl cis-trans isomerase n=1 Tax=Paludibacterium denitrificans TaxID=2675226 RepID=UPI001E3E83B6|nr:peptidyl-prolyl cis-trans isomerase [Paludibacterium denitrificans]
MEGQPNDAATRQSVLENLIRQELLLADAHRNGASVSPEQLRRAIAAIPLFQENGKFSPERYKEFLKARYLSPEAFEAQMGKDILLQGQVNALAGSQFTSRSMVARLAGVMGEGREFRAELFKPADFVAEAKVDEPALKAFYDANSKRFRTPEAVKLDYVVLSQEALAQSLQVTDAELQKFYDEHQREFAGEQRRASHILLSVPKGAPAAVKAKIKAEAEALLKQLRATPAKFAELAKAKSQDPGSAANGGSLGFFGRGMMVKPFEDVAFRMRPGQISEVVETEFGYHIIKLDEIKTASLAEVKAAVADKLKRQKAAAMFRTQSDKLAELAYQQGDSLQALQQGLKLDIHHSDWVSKAKATDAVLSNPKVLAAAFSDDVLKKKHNSEPVDVGNNTLVVLRVAAHQPERLQKLDEVRNVIRTELLAREGAKLAEKKGQALLAALKAGSAPAEQKWGETKVVSRRQLQGLPPADVRAVFAVSSAKLPAFVGVKRDTGEYVVYRVDKVIPAPAAGEAERNQLAGVVNEMKANAMLASYLEALRQRYPVTLGKQQPADQ